MGRDANLFAEKQVAAAVKQRESLRSVAAELHRVAASEVRTTEERVAAAKLLERTQRELGVSIAQSSGRSHSALLSEERALGRFSRGALAAAGISSEIKRALLLGSGSFVAGIGVGAIAKESITAAQQQQVALGQLRVSLRNTGNDWAKYRGQIEEVLQAQVRSTGFTDNELTASLSGFVRRFGDVNKALHANAITADVARAKNVSLAQAQKLVIQASFGDPRSIRVLGIELNKTTANYDALRASTSHASAEQIAAAKAADRQANELSALDQVQAKYHGNAARFLATSAGKQALFNAEMDRSKEIIGTALLPTLNHFLDSMSKWLDRMNRTGRLQRDVNKAVRDATGVFRGAASVIHHVDQVTGGFKHTMELLLALKFASVVGGWVGALRPLVGMWGAVERAAQRAVAAGSVSSGVGAVERGAVGVGAAEGVAATGFLPGIAIGSAAYLAYEIATGSNEKQVVIGGSEKAVGEGRPGAKFYYTDGESVYEVSSGKGFGAEARKDITGSAVADRLLKHYADTHLTAADDRRMRGAFAQSRPRNRTHTTAGAAGGSSTPPPTVLGLTNRQQTALLRAEGTAGTADDLVALRTQLGQIGRLLRQPGLKPGELNTLLSARNDVQGQIDSIIAQNTEKAAERARKAKERIDAATRKRKAAEKARVRAIVSAVTHTESGLKNALEKAKLSDDMSDDVRAARALEAFYRHESHDNRLSRALRDAFAAKDLRERVAIKDMLKGKKPSSSAAANEREFLAAFQSIIGDFASNYGANPVTKPGTTVNVTQHFQAPTPDRHREARMIRHAAQTAFDA